MAYSLGRGLLPVQGTGAGNKEIRCGEGHQVRCWYRVIHEWRGGGGREEQLVNSLPAHPRKNPPPILLKYAYIALFFDWRGCSHIVRRDVRNAPGSVHVLSATLVSTSGAKG
jgi:hypothetical protein